MVIEALIGAGIVLGGLFIIAYWDEIMNWLKDFVLRIKRNIPRVMHSMGVFIKGLGRVGHIIHKLFFKENNKWFQKTTTTEIEEDEIPAKYRNKMGQQQENDITDEIEGDLQLSLNWGEI